MYTNLGQPVAQDIPRPPHLHPEVTHLYHGWKHLEEALFCMRNKPRDLIKPAVVID